MYSASEWIFLDLWRFINVLLLLIINIHSHIRARLQHLVNDMLMRYVLFSLMCRVYLTF